MLEHDVERIVDILNDRAWGKYRGRVTDNAHPDRTGWVEVQVPGILGERLVWARPALPFTGEGAGFYAMPDIGTPVWVEFEAGDPRSPIWTGGFWAEGAFPQAEANPARKTFRTADLAITLDEDAGEIVLSNGDAVSVTLKANEIVLEASKLTLKSGSNQVELSAAGFDVLSSALKVV
nr:VgrG protein [uncultured bacterium]